MLTARAATAVYGKPCRRSGFKARRWIADWPAHKVKMVRDVAAGKPSTVRRTLTRSSNISARDGEAVTLTTNPINLTLLSPASVTSVKTDEK
jgi:hypothetical protein